MSRWDFLKKLVSPNRPSRDGLSATAILYPGKILIYTNDKSKIWIYIRTDKLTILPVDATDEQIGQTVRHHLNLTKFGVPYSKDRKVDDSTFIKAAGFTKKAQLHQNARNAGIYEAEGIIHLSATHNKGRGVFASIREGRAEIPGDSTFKEIGKQVRIAWSFCEGADNIYAKV